MSRLWVLKGEKLASLLFLYAHIYQLKLIPTADRGYIFRDFSKKIIHSNRTESDFPTTTEQLRIFPNHILSKLKIAISPKLNVFYCTFVTYFNDYPLNVTI